jgi:aminoglycoside phosphotransferase (APT) family kinase protein
MQAATIPDTLDQVLDPAWLSAALAPVSGGAGVIAVNLSEIIKTMASKIRFTVRFDNDPDRVHGFCLKAFLGGDQEFGGITTIREADFYTGIAPHISMRVPRCANVILDRAGRRGILIMEDLIAAGAHFCSALEPLTLDQAADSLDQIARLHAASSLLAANPWLPCRIEYLATAPHFTVAVVQTFLDDPRGVTLPARTRDASLLFAGIKQLAARNASRPQTLLHGDCHAGNLYLTDQGPGFTDWQLIQRGHWALDAAYHIAAILPVNIAENHERGLLDHYLDRLRAHGGTGPAREAAWQDYRASQIYGYYHWAITTRVDPAITAVFAERLGAGVTRHDSYKLLEL